ncbi:hypothetical protein [Halalkalicoccus subterraneus]|uniref:hypothetical protein n=1 Tax=Halalkalicoccus subterraneus TaxID=2675002 RepID=UPI000EFC7C92|nr:hypothetical protein [Halalkalicoccus subterraneus]
MLLAIIAVVLLFTLLSRPYPAVYRYAGALALAGHLLFSVVVLPVLPYEWDIALFHENALRILAGNPTGPFSAVDAFATFQALVYAVFGADTTTLSIVNGLLAVLIPLPAADIARRLYPETDPTNGLFVVLLFFPLPFLFASLPMRDALSTLLAMWLLAIVVRALDEWDYWTGLSAVPLWGAVLLLREELALLAVLAALVGIGVVCIEVFTRREVTPRSLLLAAAPAGIVGLALFATVFPVDSLDRRLQYRAVGGAAYLEGMEYGSWLDVVLAAPIRAVYFQFAPFPFHVSSTFDMLAVLSLPALVVVTATAFVSIRRTETRYVVLVMLATFYVAGIVGYGLVDANFGTTIRHRSIFVFLLCIFSAPVLETWYRSISRRIESAFRRRPQHGKQEENAEEFDANPQARDEHRHDARHYDHPD